MNKYSKWQILTVVFSIISLCLAGYLYEIETRVPVPEEPEPMKVNFAYQYGFHYGTHIVMNYFDLIEKYTGGKAEGVFYKISGGSSINEGIIAGSIQFGSMSAHAAMKGIDTGIGTKIFASMGCKVAELWTWRDDIQGIEDFAEGDIISVVKIGASHYVSMIKAYADIGRTREEAEAMFGFFSHADAYLLMEQREIDAQFAGPPYTTQFEDLGYHKIADEMSIWGTPLPGGVLIGDVSFCQEYPDIAAAVMYAWIDATNWIINNPQEASKIIGEDYGYNEEEAWELWKEANLTWNPVYGLSAVEDLAKTMYDLGLLKNQLTSEDIMFSQTRGTIGR